MVTRLRGVMAFAVLVMLLGLAALPVGAGSSVEGTIVFQSDRTGVWQMYRLLAGGADAPLLPDSNMYMLRPRVSRDGQFVVFEGKDEKAKTDIYIMEIGATDVRRVTDGTLNHFFPALSPDGTKIVFELNTQLHVVNTNGSGLTQVTTDKGRQASWSPDGSQLVYSSNRTGTYQLFIINADGTEDRQITAYSGQARFPDWSPDGTKIVFDSNMGGNYDIYVLDITTMALTRLTDNAGNDMTPRWSPDGTQIIFTSVRPGAKESLYVMSADGSDQQLLFGFTDGKKNEYSSWGM